MLFHPLPVRLPRRPKNVEAMALVVVLFILVLVTITILAFFSQAMLNRNISFSSAGQARANLAALSGLNYVKGDLLEEIQEGSTQQLDSSGANVPIYVPLSNTNMAPYRMTANISAVNIPANLIKWSSGTYAQWPATGYTQAGPTRAASGNSTLSGSSSGRYIASSRWTKPDFASSSTATNVIPDWVLLTRQGPLINTSTAISTLADSSANNPYYVVGRYAYTVYDEGGLIDVMAAGYSPTTFPTNNTVGMTYVGQKGSQGFADLSQLGLTNSVQIDSLVNGRNVTTGASMTNYISYLNTNAPVKGFLQAAAGDNAYLSRQDFIQYWTREVGGNTNSLAYMTTFSREKNAPSWSPEHDAGYWGGTNNCTDPSTLAAISYAYNANKDTASAYNRSLPNVRVQVPFTRFSAAPSVTGESATVGEPLVKHRFDLNRLSWITYNGVMPTGITAADIYNCFGLTRNSDGSWTYNHTTLNAPTAPAAQTNAIMTLDQVSAAGREPDFFELIQAVILRGSTGLCSGDYTQATNDTSSGSGGEFYRLALGTSASFPYEAPIVRADADNYLVYAREMYQIIQIGANMIDQSDADNFPTDIELNGEHIYGVENLPYINSLGDTALRAAPASLQGTTSGNFATTNQAYVHRWLTFGLWNPHQNAAVPPATGPAKVRIAVTNGGLYPIIHNLTGYPTVGDYMGRWFEPAGTSITTTANDRVDGPAWIGFKLSDYANNFSEPAMIDETTAFTSDSDNPASGNMNDGYGLVATALGWKRAGIYLGWSKSPDNPYKVPLCASLFPNYTTVNSPVLGYDAAGYTMHAPLTIELQYEDASTPGTWHTYEVLRGVIHCRGSDAGDAYMEPSDHAWSAWTLAPSGSAYSSMGGKSVSAFMSSNGGPLATNQEAAVLTFFDPRTPRLNIQNINTGGPSQLTATFATGTAPSILPSADVGPHFPKAGVSKNSRDYPVNWVDNLTSEASYYTDRDYIPRVGDAGGWTGATPLTTGAQAQRPMHLDRPFRSVAELGYVFRDDPWKTLNLTSTKSADAGLLDIFYVGPASSNTPLAAGPDMIAGKMNINSAALNSIAAGKTTSLPLQALISQALRDYSTTTPSQMNTSITSSSDIQNLAAGVVSYIQTNGPVMNISDLSGAFPQDTSVTTQNPGLKGPREALIRALADSCTTRTWNLMVDIVAQSGRFNSQAASLNSFTVEGEKHYWLHIAIDRFTGEIIDQQLEPVWE